MSDKKSNNESLSLDPDNWTEIKELGSQIMEDMLSYLETIRDNKVWQPIPQNIKNYFNQDVPKKGEGIRSIYREFEEKILPYPLGNIHPRYWGWVQGTGTPMGVISELLAATMNPNVGGREHIAIYVEKQVLNWCKSMVDFPETASGILTSGCTMANLVGLTVARNSKSKIDIRKEGLQSLTSKMTFYCSSATHSSVQKSIEILGIGSNSLIKIEVEEDYSINIEKLKNQIESDKIKGYQPICIIGNAGTVSTGAIDDLNAIADLCEKEDLWFHIDGAFGALVKLTKNYNSLVSGLERADSLAFDMHKWMYMPYGIGIALIKDKKSHFNTFKYRPNYLSSIGGGIASGEEWLTEYGIEVSRRFRALKAWISIKEHGIEKYAMLIEQNIKQAKYLESLINKEAKLQLVAPVNLNIVCFRYYNKQYSNNQLNELNKLILIKLQEEGKVAPSNTILNDIFVIRVAIVNHRSRWEDFDTLISETLKVAKYIEKLYFK